MTGLAGIPDSGIIIVDKPPGPTSHQVTAWVGEMLQRNVGHSGTLDPKVSGVLAVMFGKGVRLAPFLLSEKKAYVCLMRLHSPVDEARLSGVVSEFNGRIYQRPPVRSAVARNLRIRTVHSIEILHTAGCFVLLRIACDAGTYIRSLCHHIGLALGTGAHMQELRRISSGCYDEKCSHSLYEILDACDEARGGDPSRLNGLIIPLETAAAEFPDIVIRDNAVDAVCRGAALAGVGIIRHAAFGRGDLTAVLTSRHELVALGVALVASGEIAPGRTGLVIAPRIVFMAPGTYSRGWHKKKSPSRRPDSK